MPDISTAQIIPFPMRRMEQVGGERLERSLERLQEAAAEQAVAVAAWRAQLDHLRGRVGALGESFQDYQARLGSAKRGVDALGVQARRLEAWVDGTPTR